MLDEAKMLCVPIVATRYPTVGDAIRHGENGWVVDMNGEAVAEGILRMRQDEALRAEIIRNLENAPMGNDALLTKYSETML